MTILKMSILASILIILIAAIRMLAIHKLPKRLFVILWGIVLCRLIIPYPVPAQISMPPTMSKISHFVAESKLIDILMNSPLDRMYASMPMQSEKIVQEGFLLSIPPYVLIWTIGFVLIGSFFLITHLRYVKEYKMALPVDHPFIHQWISEQTRKIEVRQSDKILSPLTYGVWRPVILLPKTMDYTDTNRLKYVLTHEQIHIRRFDTLTKWVLVGVLCIHWFNPFVWIMYILANRDIELSCDEKVVMSFGEAAKSSYALALISMAELGSKRIALHSNFSKNAVEERIVAIMKKNKVNILSVILVVSLVCITMFTTSAESVINLGAQNFFEYVESPVDVHQHTGQTNHIDHAQAMERSDNYSLYIQETIFTDENVYAVIRLEGDLKNTPIMNGQIVTEKGQVLFELDSQLKEIEQGEGVRHFFYTGEIIADKGDSLKSKLLRDDANFELKITLDGKTHNLRTNVENVYGDILVFQPDVRAYDGDYYELILLKPDGLVLKGSSEKFTEEWVQPSVTITIVHDDGEEINLSYDTRGLISDERYPVDWSNGFDSDIGEFSLHWDFEDWELEMTEIVTLKIDGISYQIN